MKMNLFYYPFQRENFIDGPVVNLLRTFNNQRAKYPVLPGIIKFSLFFYYAPVNLISGDSFPIDIILINGVSGKKEKANEQENNFFPLIFLQRLFHNKYWLR